MYANSRTNKKNELFSFRALNYFIDYWLISNIRNINYA